MGVHGSVGVGVVGGELNAQRPEVVARGFREGLQFLFSEVRLAEHEPKLGAADGEGVAQRQTRVGEFVEIELQLARRWRGLRAAQAVSHRRDDDGDASTERRAQSAKGGAEFVFHTRSLWQGG